MVNAPKEGSAVVPLGSSLRAASHFTHPLVFSIDGLTSQSALWLRLITCHTTGSFTVKHRQATCYWVDNILCKTSERGTDMVSRRDSLGLPPTHYTLHSSGNTPTDHLGLNSCYQGETWEENSNRVNDMRGLCVLKCAVGNCNRSRDKSLWIIHCCSQLQQRRENL